MGTRKSPDRRDSPKKDLKGDVDEKGRALLNAGQVKEIGRFRGKGKH